MRAARAQGANQIELGSRELPEPGPGEVRVRVSACGICGTDLHLHHLGLYPQGMTPGHEIAGEIDAVGSGVDDRSVGQAVAVEPLASCGDCAACRAGRDAICPSVELFGINRDGGLADAVVVPARRTFPAPEGLAPATLALTEPAAVVLHGLDRGGFAAGQRVLVQGAGSIGLLAVLAAVRGGAGSVWASARHPHQAELARQFGADRVLAESEASSQSLQSLPPAERFDLVVETVGGQADTLGSAAWALAPGGCVAVLGVFMGPASVEPYPLLIREATLAWSNCYQRGSDPADFSRALALLDAERERCAQLLSHSVALADVADGYAIAGDKSRRAVKVSVLP